MTQTSREQRYRGRAACWGVLLATALALTGGSGIAQAESSPVAASWALDRLARVDQWQLTGPLDFLPGRSNPIAPAPQNHADTLTRLRTDYVQTPIYFEPNVGQSAKNVKFLARGVGYMLFLTADEAVLALRPSRSIAEPTATPMTPGAVIRIRLEGAARNPEPQIEGLEKLPGISNYLLGHDPAKWRANVPHYQRVSYKNVYPGIDLTYYGNPQQLEHDFIVAPDADPAMIQLAISGANRAQVNAEGDLALTTPGGEVVLQAPRIYQVINGRQQAVTGRYVLRDAEPAAVAKVSVAMVDPAIEALRVGFEVAQYDPKQSLVIDPVLTYSTYLGGIKDDYGTGIAVDGSGNAYVTGATASIDFPANYAGVLDNAIDGTKTLDAFVSKFAFTVGGSPSLIYSTYLGGSGDKDDVGYGIAVDNNGYAYVVGTTASSDFPVPLAPPPSPSTVLKGSKDAFIVILNASGGGPLNSIYLGGAKDDEGRGIALSWPSANGLMTYVVTGYTNSTDFPLQRPFQPALLGGIDAFVSHIDPLNMGAGGAMLYSTYLGGTKDDKGAAIAVDYLGGISITGSTASADFPVSSVPAFDTTLGGSLDGFIARIDSTMPTYSQLVYSTYLGGNGADSGASIAVDFHPYIYVTGSTASSDFPVTSRVAQGNYGGNGDAFIAKVDPALVGTDSLIYSTYLGGSGADSGAGIAVTASSSVAQPYVTGATASVNFPFTSNAQDKTLGGSGDAFVAQINGAGTQWLYVSYLGGDNGIDSGAGIASDASGVYVIGATAASDFPTTANAFDRINGSSKDAFVVKLEESYILTVIPVGSGTVKSVPPGISCRSDCAETYIAGNIVILTAMPANGSTFVGWSGACSGAGACAVTMNAAKTVTATFNTIAPSTYGSSVGVFRNGQWFLDANGNGAWEGCGTEFCFTGFGQAGDLPASGNWDGGSKSYIGVLRSGTGQWFIDRNGNRQWDGCVADGCYSGFGAPGDVPVAGDWSGNGVAKIGVFRNGQWYLDANGNGAWDGCSSDSCLSFGQAGDLPVAGNWGGVPAGVGVFRNGQWYLDANGNGAWNGCSSDSCLSFGQAGDLPAAGDWNGDGKAKIGVFRNGTWYLDYNGNGAWDGCGTDRCYVGSFGQAGDLPVAGKW